MAADKVEPENPAGQQRTGRRRAVTIDLAANGVAEASIPGAGDEPGDEPGDKPARIPVTAAGEQSAKRNERATSGVHSDAARPLPIDDNSGNEGAPPPRRSANGLTMFTFAMLGALVVLLGGYLLMFTDVLPPPGSETAETALAETERLTDELEALRRQIADTPPPNIEPVVERVAALEELVGGLAALQLLVDRLAADILANDAVQAAIGRDLESLRRDFVAGAAAAGDPEAAAQLGEEINLLGERLTAVEDAGPPDLVMAMQRQIDFLEAEVLTLAEEAALLSADAADRGRAEAAARALAFSNLQSAADRGEGFSAQLAVLAELGINRDALSLLEPAALGGVVGMATLVDAFPDTVTAILDAVTQADPDAGFWERFWDNARGVVTVQPTVPVDGDTPPAIISRMQAAVDNGDLEAALAERLSLPQVGIEASADWAALAEERIALDAAIEALAEAMLQRQAG